MAAHLASSGSSYEVFLSFSGTDVRTSFADCLYNSLVDAGIRTFRDEDELNKGNKIGPELHVAIQESRIFIPIFSENYASSKWCLNELTQISECRRTMGRIVFPIFYKVEPREVRNQSGRFAKAFEEHQMHFDETTVQKWQNALREVGELDGWDLKTNPYEGKLIKAVVKTVWNALNKRPLSASKNLVGIQSHIKEILMLLDIQSDDRKIVGIHGLGGIGKTTIARAVYNTVFHHFEGYSFIENIQENAKKYGLPHLQNQLIFDTLKQENQNITSVSDGINVIRQRLFKRKVLIVLDDVDQDIQAESLVGDLEWFGIGSKIIITCRNKDILTVQKADAIYELNAMDLDDSLELFSLHAFGRHQPPKDYLNLSYAMVQTTGGLPLALQVIGSSLFSKKISVWEGMLKKLQKVPNNDIMKRLKISYDGLEDAEQQMFLDTACFFIGMNKDIACYIWEGCDFSPQVGLDILCVKSLVTISKDGKLMMHDMLRDLGRDIVRQESIKKPWERSRMWSQEEVLDVLVKQTGTSNCEGLRIDFSQLNIDFNSRSRSQGLMSEGFSAMTELRLLQIDYAQFSGNFTNSFTELRWLSWRGCPDQYALTNFCPWKLAVLDLSHSEISENWMGWNYIKMAVHLKVLNLTSCHQLSNMPDISANRLLEVLILKDCINLHEIDASIFPLTNLVLLDMSGCESLIELPEKLDLVIKLTTLNLSYCIKLESLPNLPRNLEVLILSHCRKLVGINTSICYLRNLVTLDMSWCTRLLDLPSKISQLTSLRRLGLERCGKLEKLPEKLGCMISLTTLDLSYCVCLVELPSEICHLTSLKRLDLKGCGYLKKLPEKLGCMISLKKLDLSYCCSLVDLPIEMCQLTSLETLDISGCRSLELLPNLPSSLKSFGAVHCDLLMSLPRLSSLKNLENLCLRGCHFKLPCISGFPSSLTSLDVRGCSSIQYILGLPSSLISLHAESCKSMVKLSSTSGGLRNLRTLCLFDCTSLEEIEGIDKKLDSLKDFDIRWCKSLKKLPNLMGSKNLRTLRLHQNDVISDIEGEGMDSLEVLEIECCQSLRKVPHLRDSRRLRKLKIKDCPELSEIGSLDDFEFLQELSINGARLLKSLPDISTLKNLSYLGISQCCSMEILPDLSNLKELWQLEIEKCGKLTEILGLDRLQTLLILKIAGCVAIERLPDLSKNLNGLKIEDCKNLAEIHGFDRLECLQYLDISRCESLERLPDLSNLKYLKGLKIEGCKNLTEIHGVDRLEMLKDLDISGCESLERLPDLSNLKNLEQLKSNACKKLTVIHARNGLESLELLDFRGCFSLKKIPDLTKSKKLLELDGVFFWSETAYKFESQVKFWTDGGYTKLPADLPETCRALD